MINWCQRRVVAVGTYSGSLLYSESASLSTNQPIIPHFSEPFDSIEVGNTLLLYTKTDFWVCTPEVVTRPDCNVVERVRCRYVPIGLVDWKPEMVDCHGNSIIDSIVDVFDIGEELIDYVDLDDSIEVALGYREGKYIASAHPSQILHLKMKNG